MALAAAAALFEEFGRLVGLGVTRRGRADPVARVWSFAAGYAIAELLLIGIVGHGQLLGLAHAGEARSDLLQQLPPEAQAALLRGLSELGPISALWLLFERLAASAFQVGLTLLVAAAIEARPTARFCAALALHFLIDLPAAAYQLGTLPLWLLEVACAVAGVAALRWVQQRWQAGPDSRARPEGRSSA